MTLDELGYDEVPVAGEQRSDWVDPNSTPDTGSTGDSNTEGGDWNMDAMITSLTQIFETVVSWTGTIGDTIVDTPLLMFVVCMGLAKPAVRLFGMLFRLGK